MPRRNINNEQFETTLSANINDSATSFDVAAVTGFPAAPFGITINGEGMEVTDVSGTTLTATRGFGGTTAASHTSGDPVKFAVFAEDFVLSPDGTGGLRWYTAEPNYAADTGGFRQWQATTPPFGRTAVDTSEALLGAFASPVYAQHDFPVRWCSIFIPNGYYYFGGETPAYDGEDRLWVHLFEGKWENDQYFPDPSDTPLLSTYIVGGGNQGTTVVADFGATHTMKAGKLYWVGFAPTWLGDVVRDYLILPMYKDAVDGFVPYYRGGNWSRAATPVGFSALGSPLQPYATGMPNWGVSTWNTKTSGPEIGLGSENADD